MFFDNYITVKFAINSSEWSDSLRNSLVVSMNFSSDRGGCHRMMLMFI